MFLYPLACTIILLSLGGKFFGYDKAVFGWTTTLTLIAAIYDLIVALPVEIYDVLGGDAIKAVVTSVLPFSSLGLGWICPALLGFAIGMVVRAMKKK